MHGTWWRWPLLYKCFISTLGLIILFRQNLHSHTTWANHHPFQTSNHNLTQIMLPTPLSSLWFFPDYLCCSLLPATRCYWLLVLLSLSNTSSCLVPYNEYFITNDAYRLGLVGLPLVGSLHSRLSFPVTFYTTIVLTSWNNELYLPLKVLITVAAWDGDVGLSVGLALTG